MKIDLESQDANLFDTEVDKLNTYIQTHGAKQIGPLIQYSCLDVNEEGEADINIRFMLQADNFIHSQELKKLANDGNMKFIHIIWNLAM